MKEIILSVDPSGDLSFIYTDDIDNCALRQELGGELSIRRASHVEPVGHLWDADMTPVGGPSSLGPYNSRAAALAAEVQWLQENVL